LHYIFIFSYYPIMQENINVVARVRPFSEWIGTNHKSCVKIDSTNSVVCIKTTTKDKRFEVDRAFDQETKQDDVYNNVARTVVDGFIEGINGTIFAYGQTGSGKTYTMLGPESSSSIDDKQRGIIPRAFEDVFALLNAEAEKNPNSFKFSLKCSFLELYNEILYDLLQPGDVQVYVQATSENIGVAEFDVTSYNECLELLWRGWNKRKVAETAMNRESSRSHAIFTLNLETEHTTGLETEHTTGTVTNNRKSRLNLVDLAGSERQGQTQNTGDRLREAGKINQSLSTLARVIRQLADNPKKFINYRDSKLTLLLRDSLGGNARTTVVVNIHPNYQFVGDTISTMQFAENVKKVTNTATVNEAISCEDIETWKAEIYRLREEVRELKQQLSKCQNPLQTEELAKLQQHDNMPKKVNFDDEVSGTAVLSKAQKKQRRETIFISNAQPAKQISLYKARNDSEEELDEIKKEMEKIKNEKRDMDYEHIQEMEKLNKARNDAEEELDELKKEMEKIKNEKRDMDYDQEMEKLKKARNDAEEELDALKKEMEKN
jgi:hypothetical protein